MHDQFKHDRPTLSSLGHKLRHGLLDRRSFLSNTATGLGGIALTHLLANESLLSASEKSSPLRPKVNPAQPLAARKPHFTPRAKNVLVIFCCGACSQLETFDYKPMLIKNHGKPIPMHLPNVAFQGASGNLAQPLYKFRKRGKSGKMVSDLLPQLGELVDDMCFIHSLTSKSNTHGPGENYMSTGYIEDGFPSIGSWVTYALGSETQNLPAFVAIPDPRGNPQASINNWGSGFLSAVFQGTPFNAANPIRNLSRPKNVSAKSDRAARDLLKKFNEEHLKKYPGDSELAARIASYQLAAKMQLSVPELNDISSESKKTLDMYGANDTKNKNKAGFAKNCILARRLIEKGVRFVQLFNGAYASGGALNWDGHNALKKQYDVHGPILDQPTAALLKDMKQRGLLKDTLVVWCTEFGRMPMYQKGSAGRDHNPNGFTAWMSGAGVKAPFSFGATDELGFKAVENVRTVNDFHATILHILGLDHKRLTYYHNGLERRLTAIDGGVIKEVLSQSQS